MEDFTIEPQRASCRVAGNPRFQLGAGNNGRHWRRIWPLVRTRRKIYQAVVFHDRQCDGASRTLRKPAAVLSRCRSCRGGEYEECQRYRILDSHGQLSLTNGFRVYM
jgi:hypothetical protein